jgi:hypothetical protein
LFEEVGVAVEDEELAPGGVVVALVGHRDGAAALGVVGELVGNGEVGAAEAVVARIVVAGVGVAALDHEAGRRRGA